MDKKVMKINPTWLSVGSYSRFDTWNYAEKQINNWLSQKGYDYHKKQYGTINLCRKFAKHNGVEVSNTDALILAQQNFKDFREFVNEIASKSAFNPTPEK